METDEDDYDVFLENSPHLIQFKNLGYDESYFPSVPVDSNVSALTPPALEANEFTGTASSILGRIGVSLKEFISPASGFTQEIDILKHSGLLFKENYGIVEEISPAFSGSDPTKSFFSNLIKLLSLSVFSTLVLVCMNFRKSSVVVSTLSLSFISIGCAKKLHQGFSKRNRLDYLAGLLSSLKNYNQTYLKSLQFIRENDKIMMENYSNINRVEITGFNSFKIIDSSWLQFKNLVSDSATAVLKSLYSECCRLNDRYTLSDHFHDLTICSVDSSSIFTSLGEADCSEAYNAQLNKLKLLLFLIESEYLSFIAVILSIQAKNYSAEVKDIFTAAKTIAQTVHNFSTSIEKRFEKLFYSSRQELLFAKPELPPASNTDIFKVFTATRALALTTSSVAVQARNLKKILERDLKLTENLLLENYPQIFAAVNEAIPNIQLELLSAQHKLNSLEKHLMLAQRSLNDCSNEKETERANFAVDYDLNDTVKTEIKVGSSDFSLTQPDEVFVAITSDDLDGADRSSDDDFSEEKFVQKTLNRSSKKLIEELKMKLKDKQTEMVEREKVALERKQIIDAVEEDNLSFQMFAVEQNSIASCDKTEMLNISAESKPFSASSQNVISRSIEFFDATTGNQAHEVLPDERNQPCSQIIESGPSLLNPLAMSVTSISRSWNQELHRTEECFGSDSGSGSDADYG